MSHQQRARSAADAYDDYEQGVRSPEAFATDSERCDHAGPAAADAPGGDLRGSFLEAEKHAPARRVTGRVLRIWNPLHLVQAVLRLPRSVLTGLWQLLGSVQLRNLLLALLVLWAAQAARQGELVIRSLAMIGDAQRIAGYAAMRDLQSAGLVAARPVLSGHQSGHDRAQAIDPDRMLRAAIPTGAAPGPDPDQRRPTQQLQQKQQQQRGEADLLPHIP